MRAILNLKSVIALASGVALLYLLSIGMGLSLAWILSLYCVSLGTTIWMVVRILKGPYATTMTFDDYFYQDRPDLRRAGKE